MAMLRSTIATLIIGIGFFFAIQYGIGAEYIHDKIWYILGFFFTLSYLIDMLMSQGIKNNGKNFVNFYLTVTTIRLLASCAFIGYFLYIGLSDQQVFILDFFGLYLFYTCFEIWGIYRKLRAN